MKLTPEHKAFYEYGVARGILKERKDLMISMEGEFDGAIYYPEYRELYHIKEAIRDAWQKRAACRAWMMTSHERICENCAHEGTPPLETPCLDCLRNQAVYCEEGGNAGDGDNWEPRKEGE